MRIFRELSQNNPAYLPDLATALNNLGAHFGKLRRHEEGLQPTKEAVLILRELTQNNSAFLPDLAGALNNLGIRYSNLSRRDEALQPTEGAVRIFRELSQNNPAFLPNLAGALNNLGIGYSKLGLHEEAFKSAEKAVEIYRELSQSNPAFLPKLANSLDAYGLVQRQAREPSAATESFREGLAVLLPLLQAYRDAFLPLAQKLAGDYFDTLRQLGQEPDPELMAAYAAAFADDQDAGET